MSTETPTSQLSVLGHKNSSFGDRSNTIRTVLETQTSHQVQYSPTKHGRAHPESARQTAAVA